MSYRNLKIEILHGKYGVISINRENQYNALDDDTIEELLSCLETFRKEKEIKMLIITGEGEKAFSSGGDLKKIIVRSSFDVLQTKLQRLCYEIENYFLPIVAAINGIAMGGGVELAMACDFRISTSGAIFALPETSLGLIPSAGGTQRLVRLIGETKAKEVIMLGRKLTAKEAMDYGLISKVVEKDQLIEECTNIGKKLEQKSPMALYLAKMSINIGNKSNTYTGMNYEKMCQAVLAQYTDKEEGISSFFAKKPPNYKDIVKK